LRRFPNWRVAGDYLPGRERVIVSPSGEVLAGPLYDREGILYAELDLGEIVRGKVDFDAAGHYSRPDVFRLHVNESPRLPVEYGGKQNG
jgi:nitrilase